jgi:S-(hydroxymethyl)glutathione dehydrogenase/alcohol dehydrogenase
MYIDECFEMVREGRVVLDDIITHRLPLSKASEAYDMFKHKKDDCVKVVLKPELDN